MRVWIPSHACSRGAPTKPDLQHFRKASILATGRWRITAAAHLIADDEQPCRLAAVALHQPSPCLCPAAAAGIQAAPLHLHPARSLQPRMGQHVSGQVGPVIQQQRTVGFGRGHCDRCSRWRGQAEWRAAEGAVGRTKLLQSRGTHTEAQPITPSSSGHPKHTTSSNPKAHLPPATCTLGRRGSSRAPLSAAQHRGRQRRRGDVRDVCSGSPCRYTTAVPITSVPTTSHPPAPTLRKAQTSW